MDAGFGVGCEGGGRASPFIAAFAASLLRVLDGLRIWKVDVASLVDGWSCSRCAFLSVLCGHLIVVT